MSVRGLRVRSGSWSCKNALAVALTPSAVLGGSATADGRVSITMEAAFCVEALEDALAQHGKPDIFNTDQGSQLTGQAFTGVLANNDIAISMDGKGAWRDNVFVERLWRSVKYEEVYLRAYDSVSEARASVGRYLDFYNGRRPHSSLDGTTPDQAYFTSLPTRMAA
jgi:putative transposase